MNFSKKLDTYFEVSKKGSNVKTEIIGGVTTFVTMAYIFAVNPDILSGAGMDKGAVFTATVLASIVATLIMGVYANLPFGLSAGMGLNAFFAITVVGVMGHHWKFALTAVLIEGIIFIIMSLFKIREQIVNVIPTSIKNAVSAGIGLFIAFIGLKSSKIIVPSEATAVTLGNLINAEVAVCLIGIVVILGLYVSKVKGAILIGIIVATIAGIPLGVTHLPSTILSFPPSIKPTAVAFLGFSFKDIFSLDMLVVVFTFLFIDLFDTIGTLVGTASKANMLDKDGKLPNAGKALLSDAIGTTVGAIFGTSTVTTFVESSAGIAEGARTGLASVATAILMALTLFLAPLFLVIPASATASALIVVGMFMISNITKIDFDDYTEGFPAFLTVIMMPLTGSIGDGLMIGIIFYVVGKVLARKFKDVSVLMYVLAIIFIIKYISPAFKL